MKLNKVVLAMSSVLALNMITMDFATAADSSRDVGFYFGTRVGGSTEIITNDSDDRHDSGSENDTVFKVAPYIGVSVPWTDFVGSRFEAEWFYNTKASYSYKVFKHDFGTKYDSFTENTDIKTTGAFFNTYVDFYVNSLVTPYVGVGLGYAHVKAEGKYFDSQSNNNFAVNVGGGVALNLAKNFAVDFGIRYNYLGKAIKNVYYKDIDLSAVDYTVGLRLQF